MKRVTASLIAAFSVFIFVAPASAVPVSALLAPQVSNDVVEVQHRRDRRHSNRFERRGGHTYYRGHRGSRHARPGYRRHGDYWFPPAAFALGAIVGGAIASQPAPRERVRDYGSAHVDWCYGQYRSYRASDNTFQPYNGPRRQCRSPY